ncbi:MAG: tetratricopeptide repeat protein, partial [Paracoccaceae bacterium]
MAHMAGRQIWKGLGGGLICLWLLTGAQAGAQTIEDNTVNTGDNANVNIGGQQTIIDGYSIEQHEAALARREAQLRSDLERAHSAEQQLLNRQLAEVERQRTDLQASYQQTVRELEALQAKLSDLGEGIEDAKIAAAKAALAEGDRSKADALFAEVEALEQEGIDRAAEAAYQRGVIAEQEVRWADAADHFSKSARLGPSVHRLHKAQELAWRAGRYQAGYRFALERLDLTIAEFGKNTTQHATALNNLALMLNEVGQYEQAEPLYREAIKIGKATIGEGHPEYATRLSNLASLLRDMGRYEEAEPLYREAIKIDKAALGEGHPGYAIDLNNLANLLKDMGRYEEAEPLYREAIKIGKAT